MSSWLRLLPGFLFFLLKIDFHLCVFLSCLLTINHGVLLFTGSEAGPKETNSYFFWWVINSFSVPSSHWQEDADDGRLVEPLLHSNTDYSCLVWHPGLFRWPAVISGFLMTPLKSDGDNQMVRIPQCSMMLTNDASPMVRIPKCSMMLILLLSNGSNTWMLNDVSDDATLRLRWFEVLNAQWCWCALCVFFLLSFI